MEIDLSQKLDFDFKSDPVVQGICAEVEGDPSIDYPLLIPNHLLSEIKDALGFEIGLTGKQRTARIVSMPVYFGEERKVLAKNLKASYWGSAASAELGLNALLQESYSSERLEVADTLRDLVKVYFRQIPDRDASAVYLSGSHAVFLSMDKFRSNQLNDSIDLDLLARSMVHEFTHMFHHLKKPHIYDSWNFEYFIELLETPKRLYDEIISESKLPFDNESLFSEAIAQGAEIIVSEKTKMFHPTTLEEERGISSLHFKAIKFFNRVRELSMEVAEGNPLPRMLKRRPPSDEEVKDPCSYVKRIFGI